MATPKWNQFRYPKLLYLNLKIALWACRSVSKKHKAYFLFSVLFSEAWYMKDNVDLVRQAVRDNTLHLIPDKRHPDKQDDSNIDIYFLDEGRGKFFIVLMYTPFNYGELRSILDIIPVKTNNYPMTQIYPYAAKSQTLSGHKKPASQYARRGE